jgi:hypothetical protein
MVTVGLLVRLNAKPGREADEPGRQAHLAGRVAAALMAQAPDLPAEPPSIERADVLAHKLPASRE